MSRALCRGRGMGSSGARSRLLRSDSGQALAEAPVAVVVLVAVVILLLQPTILLYDRVILGNASAEAARIMVTDLNYGGDNGNHAGHLAAFVGRRLRAIPGSPYFIDGEPVVSSSSSGDYVSVTVGISVKPLPILGAAVSWLGTRDEGGNMVIEVTSMAPAAWDASDEIDPGVDSWKW